MQTLQLGQSDSEVKSLSSVRLFATPWTVAYQAPLFMGFSKQEYWSGLPCPPPGDHPDPGIESLSPVSPALAGGFFTAEPLEKHFYCTDTTFSLSICELMDIWIISPFFVTMMNNAARNILTQGFA